ncbi:MAG: DUF4231 domain-containing protein [Desulfobacterales bacterium]|nr:MAG: DUF4231 domain-containing protein [Desulfobacterales bacterium]
MDQQNFDDYFNKRYLDQIGYYEAKSGENQLIYRYLQWALIILAALTPALIELDLNTLFGKGFSHIATLTSVTVAILTAALKTFKYQENWINYRTTCEALKKERYLYEAGLGDYQNSADRQAQFIDRVEALISRENTLWLSFQKKKEEKK